MKIDSNNLFGIDTPEQANRKKSVDKAAKPEEKQGAVVSEPSVKKDAITISFKAKETVSLAKVLKELPEVRKDKVAELKAKIQSGEYSVSSKAIAEKIVESAVNDLF